MRVEAEGLRIERLESLVDGTIAVAATLLILLVEPPPAHEAQGRMVRAVVEQWHHLAAYLISFLLIATYWLNHHGIFDHVRRAPLPFVWLNLLFLATVVFIPFPTALVVEYAGAELSLVLYGAAHLLCSASLLAMWLYAERAGLVGGPGRPGPPPGAPRRLILPPLLYGAAMLASLWSVPIALGLFALVPIAHVAVDRSEFYLAEDSRSAR